MHDRNHFTLSKGGYVVNLRPFGGFYPSWSIVKDGVEIDHAAYHRPITSRINKELAGKAACEKRLNELLK